VLARYAEPAFFNALTAPTARIAIAFAIVLGILVMLLITRRRETFARIAVGAEVVAVLAGWFGAQAPQLVPGRWTIETAAAPPTTLNAFLIAVACGALILIPSLFYLFAIFKIRSRPA
jgi:cytochrome d ubiquinol oxidase subunit II